MAKKGLYANINAGKKKGISRSKKNSTITKKAYANMKAGFPKKKKKQPLIDRQMMDARTKGYREHRARLEAARAKREERKRQSKFIEKVKESVTTQEYTPKEEVELDEAKFELYHDSLTSAMRHAFHVAKKHHGITIDPTEIRDKVAMGPSKPSSGKTNKYSLKGDKGSVQIQVYNKGGSKPFELNMYKS